MRWEGWGEVSLGGRGIVLEGGYLHIGHTAPPYIEFLILFSLHTLSQLILPFPGQKGHGPWVGYQGVKRRWVDRV